MGGRPFACFSIAVDWAINHHSVTGATYRLVSIRIDCCWTILLNATKDPPRSDLICLRRLGDPRRYTHQLNVATVRLYMQRTPIILNHTFPEVILSPSSGG